MAVKKGSVRRAGRGAGSALKVEWSYVGLNGRSKLVKELDQPEGEGGYQG